MKVLNKWWVSILERTYSDQPQTLNGRYISQGVSRKRLCLLLYSTVLTTLLLSPIVLICLIWVFERLVGLLTCRQKWINARRGGVEEGRTCDCRDSQSSTDLSALILYCRQYVEEMINLKERDQSSILSLM